MKEIEIKTGFGFYRDTQGHIVSKVELPPGKHPLADGLDYTEVANAQALAMVEVYQDPAEILRAENETKINAYVRSQAIAALKATGELPQDYQ